MAKKFRFRLQSILEIRQNKVDEDKNALNVAIRFRNVKEEEIERVRAEKTNSMNWAENTTNALSMQAMKDYWNSLDAQIAKKEREKIKLIEIEDARRERLRESMKEEKVIARLKEKAKEEHRKALDKEEANFLDEVATQQYFRKEKD